MPFNKLTKLNQNKVMNAIKNLQMNQFSALNNP